MLLSPEMQELMKTQWVRELVAMNREDALEEGLEKGEKKGLKRGEKKGKRALMEEMLRHVLSRHLQRELNPAERRALSARAGTLTGPELADLLANDGAASLLSSVAGTETTRRAPGHPGSRA